MHAYQGNLTDPSDPSPAAFNSDDGRFRDFDVAGVGLGFHHFEDPELSARRLVERLRPGGVFIILDFLPHEKMDHALPAAHTVMHHGFSEERMRAIFEQAGAGWRSSGVVLFLGGMGMGMEDTTMDTIMDTGMRGMRGMIMERKRDMTMAMARSRG
ncbi:hypothetical protein COL516b_011916 [Colletotrichum fioriniae]|nr:uncharacterized protein COL516b_011916 [Colletotrichum fioriniae]KAJ0296164.1 hypothetical protein COL516b_011916 [Colletotrichum fioriniae]